jgi:predicted aspartyl protease
MPIYNRFWIHPDTKQQDPAQLAGRGPALQIEISVPDEYAAVLNQNSTSIPQPQVGTVLIDTGARFTAVDIEVLNALRLPPVSTIQVATPSGQEEQGVYMCKLVFPGTDIPPIQPMAVTGSKLAPFGHVALIGRDILNYALLIYDGRHGMWTIAF